MARKKKSLKNGQALAADWERMIKAAENITADAESAASELPKLAVNTVTDYAVKNPKQAFLVIALLGFAAGYWARNNRKQG